MLLYKSIHIKEIYLTNYASYTWNISFFLCGMKLDPSQRKFSFIRKPHCNKQQTKTAKSKKNLAHKRITLSNLRRMHWEDCFIKENFFLSELWAKVFVFISIAIFFEYLFKNIENLKFNLKLTFSRKKEAFLSLVTSYLIWCFLQ